MNQQIPLLLRLFVNNLVLCEANPAFRYIFRFLKKKAKGYRCNRG
jgi:hypothetical protein